MEAQTKLAAVMHNNNAGRQQAIIKVLNRNIETVGTKGTTLSFPKSRCMVRNMWMFSDW